MDDEGAFSVLEAVLALLIIAASIFFVTLSQGGVQVEPEGRQDVLSTIAQDVLDALAADGVLEPAVQDALQGDSATAITAIRPYIPEDVRFSVKLDNGYKTLDLTGSPIAEIGTREAGSAHAVILQSWGGAFSVDASVSPGQWINATTPTGDPPSYAFFVGGARPNMPAPPGQTAVAWNVAWGESSNHVPLNAPFGRWSCDLLCKFDGVSVSQFAVVPPGTSYVETAPIGVQLQLWWIA